MLTINNSRISLYIREIAFIQPSAVLWILVTSQIEHEKENLNKYTRNGKQLRQKFKVGIKQDIIFSDPINL